MTRNRAVLAQKRNPKGEKTSSGLAARRGRAKTVPDCAPSRGAALWLALMLALAGLACDVNPPVYTPSAPQQTAIILNSTYQAQATLTAQAGQVTPGLSSTPTPTSSP